MVADNQGIRVLHVDDKPDFVEMTASYLQRQSDVFTVETAMTAREGLTILAEKEIDCVVSDHDLEEQTGLEFLECVRADYPDLPFILFTSMGSEEVASEAISAGVSDYLQKERGEETYTVLANRIEQAVKRTRAQQERTRQLDAIETAQEGISILGDDGHFICVNQAYATLYGYSPEQMIGEHWELIYREEDVAEMREDILPTVKATGHWHGTTTGLRSDGTTFVEDHVLSTTANGELVCTVRDITERRELQEKFELVARASTDAFWDWDPRTDEISRNSGYLSEFGYDPSDIGDETDWWRNRIHPNDRDRVLSALERAVRDPSVTYDETYRFETKDGEYGYLRSRGYVVYDADDEPERMVGAHIDITERKQRELELEQQNERLQEFASIVSHDLRNPLNVASGYIELAAEECDSDHLKVVDDAIDRSQALISDLLTLARLGDAGLEDEAVDLADMVEDCWQNVDTGEARLVSETGQTIQADKGRLKQLLENLIGNAIEHAGENSEVRVGDLDEAGFYVEDDGPGIPIDERAEIFEPGYSSSDGGTGFGLAIVNRVVEDQGWDIHISESADGGARFEITGVGIS